MGRSALQVSKSPFVSAWRNGADITIPVLRASVELNVYTFGRYTLEFGLSQPNFLVDSRAERYQAIDREAGVRSLRVQTTR